MRITLPIAPAGCLAVVERALSHLSFHHSATRTILDGFDFFRLTAAVPHQVFLLRLEDLLTEDLTSKLYLNSWRYLILSNETPLLMTQVGEDSLEFLGSTSSEFARNFVECLDFLESQDQISEESFELRALEIPTLFFSALWLHSGEHDLFAPFSTFEGQAPFAILTAEELTRELRVQASSRLNSVEDVM